MSDIEALDSAAKRVCEVTSFSLSVGRDVLELNARMTTEPYTGRPLYDVIGAVALGRTSRLWPVAIVVGDLKQYIPDEVLSHGADLIGYEALAKDYNDLHQMMHEEMMYAKGLETALKEMGVAIPPRSAVVATEEKKTD